MFFPEATPPLEVTIFRALCSPDAAKAVGAALFFLHGAYNVLLYFLPPGDDGEVQ